MPIWIDGDACPKVVKDILFRAAHQRQIPLTLVANQYIATPASPYIHSLQVSSGFDEADNYIVATLSPGDLVITADIPLAADALAKGAAVLNPRGQEYTRDTIAARLTMRDFMETLRSSGMALQDGPAPFSQQDRQAFANALDRWIAKQRKI